MRSVLTAALVLVISTNGAHADVLQPDGCASAVTQGQSWSKATRKFAEDFDARDGTLTTLDPASYPGLGESMFSGPELERFVDYANAAFVLKLALDDYIKKLDALSGAISACAANAPD